MSGVDQQIGGYGRAEPLLVHSNTVLAGPQVRYRILPGIAALSVKSYVRVGCRDHNLCRWYDSAGLIGDGSGECAALGLSGHEESGDGQQQR